MMRGRKKGWVMGMACLMAGMLMMTGCGNLGKENGTGKEKETEKETYLLPASEAKLLEGEVDGEKQMPSYNEDKGVIEEMVGGASVVYTVPEGYDGNYDLYLQIGRSVYMSGTTVFEVRINDRAYVIPAELGSVDKENDTYDMGRFLMAADVILKSGDQVQLVAKNGFSSLVDGKFYTFVPPVGDFEIYKTGEDVKQGYGEGELAEWEETDLSDPLSGKNIYWLGSSVTYGSQAKGYSMVEYISGHHQNTTGVNYSISGTTLANLEDNSYVARMFSDIPADAKMDMLIVQLSTNDATSISRGAGLQLGAIAEGRELEDFDDTTVIGAMETIIAYAGETWECPIVFYTGTKYDSEVYQQMVDALYQLKDKWGVGIVDLWNDPDMNAVAGTAAYDTYMADPIHPNRSGYETWWGPKIDEKLLEIVEN